MRAVRSAAKRFLAPDMRSVLADVIGRAGLMVVPKNGLKVSKLRDRSEVDLSRVFQDEHIHKAWEADRQAIFSKWPSGGGAVNPGDCRAIYYLIASCRPRSFLEIGTNVASSTIYIAAALSSHCAPDAKVTTVDIVNINAADGPWSRYEALRQPPVAYMRDFGLADRVRFETRPALDFLADCESFDIIFLDGSHAHYDVYREVAAALRVLNPGGMILLHDYYPAGQSLFPGKQPLLGPFRALERYKREGESFYVLPFGELPWPTRKRQARRFSSLALMLR